MEGSTQECPKCGEQRDLAEFFGKGRRFVRCRSCRAEHTAWKQAHRAKALAQPVPEGQMVCPGCLKIRNTDLFKSQYVAERSTCQKCRDRDAIRREARLAEAEGQQTPANYKICKRCVLPRPAAEFRNGENPEHVACAECREREATRAKREREEYPERNRERSLKSRNKRRANDPLKFKRDEYKDSAKRKNLEMLLTDEQMDSLFQMPCTYCGAVPLNGIDRVDSDKGYIPNNCVACCSTCNYAKGHLKLQQYLTQCVSIALYTTTGQLYGLWPFAGVKSVTFSRYKSSARSRKLEFTLTKDEFKSIIACSCHYCGKHNDETHQNGIDRKDSLIGYLAGNCVPCCWPCNKMKDEAGYEQFLSHCRKVALHPRDQ